MARAPHEPEPTPSPQKNALYAKTAETTTPDRRITYAGDLPAWRGTRAHVGSSSVTSSEPADGARAHDYRRHVVGFVVAATSLQSSLSIACLHSFTTASGVGDGWSHWLPVQQSGSALSMQSMSPATGRTQLAAFWQYSVRTSSH
jgi:hypothetical protein